MATTNDGTAAELITKIDKRSVFVVHGRNEALRKALFDFLRSIDLKPMEWTRAVELTGKGSPYIGEILDAAFTHAQAVVVLMTPDEVAYLQPRYGHGEDDPDIHAAAQARPNVLFEAGMALGRSPDRTVLVEVGTVRPFSDVAGRHTVRLSDNVAQRQALAARLKTAGCPVDLNGTDWQSTGDFTAPPPPGDGLPLGRRVPSTGRTRSAIDFDVKYLDQGGNKLGKLQIINRGTETAYEVALSAPAETALDLQRVDVIDKIPGEGKYVTVDAMNQNRFFGGSHLKSAFDLTITARTESGERFSQDVFLDVNG
ncbi:TIR domain-containing protein [Phytoactinopolyspora halotolerans]|uniref:Nucleotide-binding protein n=1 Tax=Phytoactinopolyspora halotolerans TaxID=1981512 RepID=A0A6L9SHF0_9ACTN|nr:nucleotide-binding protein [Phytoactinopolyspora halotolerans]NEE03852.1 nucleotide-binding protein [Phytoactinopolyspora halotolerans]